MLSGGVESPEKDPGEAGPDSSSLEQSDISSGGVEGLAVRKLRSSDERHIECIIAATCCRRGTDR